MSQLPARPAPNQMQRATPRTAIEQKMATIVKALPNDQRTIERFKAAAYAVATMPHIANCNPNSVVKVIYECARLNLIPDPILQHAYIVPFKGEATLTDAQLAQLRAQHFTPEEQLRLNAALQLRQQAQ